jgi:hypothetical protein
VPSGLYRRGSRRGWRQRQNRHENACQLAFGVLHDPGAKPGDGKAIAALVVHEAQRLYSMRYL